MDGGMLGQVRPPQNIFVQSVRKVIDLGFHLPFNDGRVYVYSKAAETLVKGELVQAPTVSEDYDRSLAVAVAGVAIDRQLAVTLLNAHDAFVANAYEDGWLLVDTHTEEGLMRKIKSNNAFLSTADATVIFKFRDALGEAVAVSTHEVKILVNPYNLVIPNVADSGRSSNTGRTLGVPVCDVTANYYFWLLVRGMGPGVGYGTAIVPGTSLTGNAKVMVVAAAGDPIVGVAASYCHTDSQSLMVFYKCE